jgi:hypothetical protein
VDWCVCEVVGGPRLLEVPCVAVGNSWELPVEARGGTIIISGPARVWVPLVTLANHSSSVHQDRKKKGQQLGCGSGTEKIQRKR